MENDSTAHMKEKEYIGADEEARSHLRKYGKVALIAVAQYGMANNPKSHMEEKANICLEDAQ